MAIHIKIKYVNLLPNNISISMIVNCINLRHTNESIYFNEVNLKLTTKLKT